MRIDHQNVHFISDFHIGHQNILRFDKRPFKDLEEMHITLIKNWNSVVSKDDLVFYLGDLSWAKPDLTKWFVWQLEGKIHYILGNHDRMKDINRLGRFDSVHEYGTELQVADKDANRGKQDIIMAHYPFLVWNKHHHGAWHLHGHCHGSLMGRNPDFYKRKVMDIGCNVALMDYTPISYTDLKSVMNKKDISALDHHGSDDEEE